MALGVEKKITQLLNFGRSPLPWSARCKNGCSWTLPINSKRPLTTYNLRGLKKRDELQPPNFERVNTVLRNAIATGEAALRKAERFVVLSNRPRSPARSSTEPPADKLDCLDNTLKPEGCLKRTMTLEEARIWIRKFDQWFVWNVKILNKKGLVAQRVLLENFLDDRILSKVQSDVNINDSTPVQGPDGLLKRLELY